MNKTEQVHMGNLYVTDVCNRFEEDNYTKEQAERMYREKVLQIIPLYADWEEPNAKA